MLVKLLHKNAKAPQKSYAGDAGWDLCATHPQTILCGHSAIIGTGIAVAIPDGYYGRVASRSGMAAKSSIEVGAGVVDSAFRGELLVVLRNWGDKLYHVKPGDKIAQLVITKISTDDLTVVEELPKSNRDQAGFGSTGV